LMGNYLLKIRSRLIGISNLKFWRVRLKRVLKKKSNIIAIIILVLCMRLFFYSFFDQNVYAENIAINDTVSPEIIDPMNKIDRGIINPEKDDSEAAKYCEEKKSDKNPSKKEAEHKRQEEKLNRMIGGYPMEKMIPYIAERDEKTAAFLVAIAKKESGWGEHAPSKSGRDCYNYWGYKGNYHLVMGYSCFDSPEHAIKVVGDKIDQLIAKKVDTPARMVVWKCGSSCAGHSPESVRSWIGTVDTYLRKLIS
jgi:hypothetical protein